MAGVIERMLRDRGFECQTRVTSRRGEAESLAMQAIADHRGGGELCVVACGGDGTMQEVANAVAGAHMPAPAAAGLGMPPGAGSERVIMGVAPAGRCNDFARGLGITATPAGIVDVLANGAPTPVDLGRVCALPSTSATGGGRYFCTVAALGFDAAVSRFVNEMRMPLRGAAAYVYGTLRVLLRYQAPRLHLRGDFGEYEGPVLLAASANTPWYGGAMKIAPAADAFDGRMDVCLVTQTTRRRVLSMLGRVMSGGHVDLPEVRMLRTRCLHAEVVDPGVDVEVWADGEPMTRLPATIESVHGAVHVLLPDGCKTAGA